MFTFMEIYSTHKFKEHGRCWNCGIKSSYLGDFIHAYLKGNYPEDALIKMSECHGKLKVGDKKQ